MSECLFILLVASLFASWSVPSPAEELELRFKNDFLHRLVAAVPSILEQQDPETGRFGHGVWIVNDQHPMFPLAVAWAADSPDNPYYHDQALLKAITLAGDALIEDQDENGMWVFRKKDGSTWGKIYQPWTYSRWVRAFALIKDAMPPEDRRRWEQALILGYSGIVKTQFHRVHNIPAHHAMGAYIAGLALGRPDWCESARAFMAKVVAAQDPAGFWSENCGPVVAYNDVYIDALGVYYAVSGDKSVPPALERAARFHSIFTYPDGSRVETLDERNPYHPGIYPGNVGFTFSKEGRGFLMRQIGRLNQSEKEISPDLLASFCLYGEEGPARAFGDSDGDFRYVMEENKALVRRKGPWFIALSAYHCPVPNSRWLQDRQNFLSVFHDRVGLIIGGGNTKLQPLWSNFTIGDVSLLRHKPRETAPKFTPGGELYHVPSAVGLKIDDPPGVGFFYGSERCSIVVEPINERSMRIHLHATTNSGLPVAAHITLLPQMGKPLIIKGLPEQRLDGQPFRTLIPKTGGWIFHAGWRLMLPEDAIVEWPVLPHNPYVKDGSATPAQGRIVVTLPFSKQRQEQTLLLTIE